MKRFLFACLLLLVSVMFYVYSLYAIVMGFSLLVFILVLILAFTAGVGSHILFIKD